MAILYILAYSDGIDLEFVAGYGNTFQENIVCLLLLPVFYVLTGPLLLCGIGYMVLGWWGVYIVLIGYGVWAVYCAVLKKWSKLGTFMSNFRNRHSYFFSVCHFSFLMIILAGLFIFNLFYEAC